MAKRYIIDEVRANTWMARLRDRETGEVVEVPIQLGALWPGRLRGDAVPREPSEPLRTQEEPPEAQGPSPSETPPSTEHTPVAAEPPAAKKPRRSRDEDRGIPRVTDPEDLREVMSSPALRSLEVDEDTIDTEDAAAFRKMQAMMRRARGKRAGKRGDLGWDETTDSGRSGLISRFGKGAFKILHASGDTYALFFEWDDGRYERLGCGPAEDMMNLANRRAQDEPPEPPPSHLSLELARLYCGSPEQKASAAERLEPAFAEARQNTPGAQHPPPTEEHTDAVPEKPARRAPRAQQVQDPDLDRRLSDSLKAALADLDAREEQERRDRGE